MGDIALLDVVKLDNGLLEVGVLAESSLRYEGESKLENIESMSSNRELNVSVVLVDGLGCALLMMGLLGAM